MTSKNTRISLALIAISVFLNSALFIFLFGAFNESELATLKVMRAKEISAVSSNLSKRIYDLGVALGGFTVTSNKLFAHRFDKTIRQIPHDMSDLRDLIGQDSPRQFQALMKVSELLPDILKSMGARRLMIEDGREEKLDTRYRQLFDTARGNAEQIQQLLRVISDENAELANSKIPERLPESATIKMLLMLGGAGNLILGIVLAALVKRAV